MEQANKEDSTKQRQVNIGNTQAELLAQLQLVEKKVDGIAVKQGDMEKKMEGMEKKMDETNSTL
jgi:hypothetical protein